MTGERDVERVLEQWLVNGIDEMPDRVYASVLDRVERQRQRPAWRLLWKEPHMTTYLQVAAGMAAVAIVAIAGINLAGSGPRPGAGGPPSSPSPSAEPSPSESPTTLSSVSFGPGLRVAAAAGWQIAGDTARAVTLSRTAEPSGAPPTEILVMSGPFVGVADPDCEGRPAAGVGASAAELVAALSGDPSLTTASQGVVALGDTTGQSLDVGVAPGWTGTCAWSQGKPAVLLLMATDQGPGFGVGGTEQARLILVDVGTTVVAIVISSADAATQNTTLAKAMPVVEAIQLGP